MNLTRNEIETLKLLLRKEKATRRDIADETQLSPFVVSSVIEMLEKKGLVEVLEESQAKRGRPSNFYHINPDSGYFLGISADLTVINIILLNSINRTVSERQFPTGKGAGDSSENFNPFLYDILDSLKRFLQENQSNKKKIRAIGIGVPGIIDSDRGIWLRGLRIPGIKHINIRELIQDKYNIPVVIEDVARTVTYYEKSNGKGKGTKNFFLLHLGRGVGGGLVVNGEILKGYHGFAGEIGHIIVEPSGYRCHCGYVGCLETVASLDGILHRLNDKMREVVVSSMHSHDFHREEFQNLREVLEAAENGDKFTQSVLSGIGSFIGDACSNVLLLFNPRKIIITGPNAILADYLRDTIYQRIRERVFSEMLSNFELVFSNYSQDHEAYGAALFARDLYWQKEIL
ncbi:MAG: ROK family protein [Spirochaetes bacterium]|nr:ROK family protein [Spirochaetota bacterium]